MAKLGIGITTYDRRHRLEAAVERVRRLTGTPHRLLVADDGSRDETRAYLRAARVSHVAGENRGIAWNKNRLLYALAIVERCDAVILLEDDTHPTAPGWERPWIEAVARHGHANFASPGTAAEAVSGAGTPEDPFRNRYYSGNCAGFGRDAIRAVGFMDTRFRAYGYEHGEHTDRLIRAGFGGDPATRLAFLIEGALEVHDIGRRAHYHDLAENGEVFVRVREERSLFRPAWRTPEEMRTLRAELRTAVIYEPGGQFARRWRLTARAMRAPDPRRMSPDA